MNYLQALDYIYSFANFETRPAQRLQRRDYTLDRIRALLRSLGDPQQAYPTVHITGTKGKGSAAAMITSVLQAAGHRVGLFTSPHLHTYRERVRVSGQLISEEEVADWIATHRTLLDQFAELTTFEVTTALAFDTFARKNVDIAVIEVGMGGRLDTTNVITPLVAVITSISLDHTPILGSTVAEIAADKSGIIKPGVPAVTAPQPREALEVIQTVALKLAAPLVQVGRDWVWEPVMADLSGQSFHAHRLFVPTLSVANLPHAPELDPLTISQRAPIPETALHDLWIPLLGGHQLINATTALATLDVLHMRGIEITPQAIRHGLRTVKWPGRLEILGHKPLIVVDGAHNDASVRALWHAVEELVGQRRTILVFGASMDKNFVGMLKVLLPTAEVVIVTRARHPRAAVLEELVAAVQTLGREARVIPTVDQAFTTALNLARDEDLVLVTGSLFVAAEAREAWFTAQGGPLPPCDPPKRET